jgi:magnesium-transporting ATPase (P-type)
MCEGFQVSSDQWHALAEAMAEQGYRVLALAQGIVEEPIAGTHVPSEPSGLLFLGLVGMIDPLRPGVIEAVKVCQQAGITVAMVTGDHPTTALAIARELGMATHPDQVVVGADLEGQSIEALAETISRARVFARVAPHQKLELVRAARQAGHYVAVTGDGVNDAPALREANIGVAMGKAGTDVAREAAELVISDDNFATITAGVEEGRIAYDNIRKVIYLLISTGAAEVVLVCLAVASGAPLPLLPVQLLWLNLVTNGIQDVALAFEPSEGDTLQRKPRPPQESIFNRLMLERTVVAAVVMGVMGFGLFRWLLDAGWTEADARNMLLLLMVLFENVHVFNSRSETKSVFAHSPWRSPIVLAGVAIGFSVHLAALYVPFGQTLLGTSPVDASTWMLLIGMASCLLIVMEIHKLTWKYRQRTAGKDS